VQLGAGGFGLLAVFLAAAGLVLDAAFRASAERSARSEAELHVLSLVGLAELVDGAVRLPGLLPDARWQQPGSGLYGLAFTGDGRVAWRSPSLAGLAHAELLAAAPAARGVVAVDRAETGALGSLFRARIAVAFAGAGAATDVRFVAALADTRLRAEVASFRDTLWRGLVAVALVMSVALALLFGLVSRPLGRMARAVDAVERGERDGVGDGWPTELAGVAANLDRFIAHERSQRAAYVQALENVAHSLKTPLTVLRNALAGDQADLAEARRQVERMEVVLRERLSHIVVRPLRAARLPVRPVLDDVARALARIHPGRRFDVECAAGVPFPGDEAHLHELVGNLLDNAAKYGRRVVRVSATADARGLRLVVDDDGDGFPEGARSELLARGVRADRRRAGQGLGLAMVAEVVAAYGGRLELGVSPLGGARVDITLP
jgi:two-component system sensor histidine kinase PhoQ